MATIRKRYDQVPHLTQNTTWESNENTINITNKSQVVSPFTAGDHKAAMNRQKSMRNTRRKTQMILKRSTALERSVKISNWEGGLNRFHGANLTLSSDVDQETYMFGLHERPLAYQCSWFKGKMNRLILLEVCIVSMYCASVR